MPSAASTCSTVLLTNLFIALQKALIEKTKITHECLALHDKIAAEYADLNRWRAMKQEARDGAASASQAAVNLKREATRAVEQANSMAPNERRDFVSKLWLKFHPGESTLTQDNVSGYVYLSSFLRSGLGCSMRWHTIEHHAPLLRNSACRAVSWATRHGAGAHVDSKHSVLLPQTKTHGCPRQLKRSSRPSRTQACGVDRGVTSPSSSSNLCLGFHVHGQYLMPNRRYSLEQRDFWERIKTCDGFGFYAYVQSGLASCIAISWRLAF